MFNSFNYNSASITTKLAYIYHLGDFGDKELANLINNSIIDNIYKPIFYLQENVKIHYNMLINNTRYNHEKNIIFKATQMDYVKLKFQERYEEMEDMFFHQDYCIRADTKKTATYINNCDIAITENMQQKMFAEITLFEKWKNGKSIGENSRAYTNNTEKYLQAQKIYFDELKTCLKLKRKMLLRAEVIEDMDNDSEETIINSQLSTCTITDN